jgi:hypothetical protein
VEAVISGDQCSQVVPSPNDRSIGIQGTLIDADFSNRTPLAKAAKNTGGSGLAAQILRVSVSLW